MNWFKENKFLGGLLVVNVIIAAIIIFLGMKTGSSKEEKLAEVKQHLSDKSGAKKLNPYPTPENVKAKKENLKVMIAKAEAARSKIVAFRPESIEKISVSSFADRLKNADASVRALFENNNVKLSEDAYLGFESYKGQAPIESATGVLAYELAAIEWLFSEIGQSGITAVSNFSRDELAVEKAASVASKSRKKKTSSKKSKGKRSSKDSSGPALVTIAEKLPMSLTFKGPESSVREALQRIANSDKFFFETRVPRVKNPALVPSSSGVPVKKSVQASAPAASDDGFGAVESDVPASSADSSASQQILHRVAGGEDVSVFLKLDLLLFSEEQTFPEIK